MMFWFQVFLHKVQQNVSMAKLRKSVTPALCPNSITIYTSERAPPSRLFPKRPLSSSYMSDKTQSSSDRWTVDEAEGWPDRVRQNFLSASEIAVGTFPLLCADPISIPNNLDEIFFNRESDPHQRRRRTLSMGRPSAVCFLCMDVHEGGGGWFRTIGHVSKGRNGH